MTDPEGLAREGEAYEFRDERGQDCEPIDRRAFHEAMASRGLA
ncbi:MAG: hypothetical protein OXH07_00960 [Chloroflexi bacterium]|nr:hypothetical protein [Chloroflexota bacterium]